MSGARLLLEPALPPVFVAVVLGGLAALSGAAHWRRPGTRRFSVRALCLGLRLAALAALALALLRPAFVWTETRRERRAVLLVLDTSRSMDFRDAGPRARAARGARVREVLEAARGEFADLRIQCDLRCYTFDRELRRADGLATLLASKSAGESTDLAAVLEALAREAGAEGARSAILLSDGAQSAAGGSPRASIDAAALRCAGALAIETVPVGLAEGPRDFLDLAIEGVDLAEDVFLHETVPVRVRLASASPHAVETRLRVAVDGEEREARAVRFGGGDSTRAVEFEFVAAEVDTHRVELELVPVEGEASTENNRAVALVRVHASRVRVHLVETRLRPEAKFLRRALAALPDLEVHGAVTLPGTGGGRGAGLLPEPEAAWRPVRVVVLGDVPASRFAPGGLARLARFVSEGGGLLALAGPASRGLASYAGTPLAVVLPVEPPRDGRLSVRGRPPLRARPTEVGLRTPACVFTPLPRDNAERWDALGALEEVWPVARVRPGAAVWIETTDDRGEARGPLLAVQRYGRGRAAALLTDSTWRWVLAKRPHRREHAHLWGNLLAHLAGEAAARDVRPLSVRTDQLVYRVEPGAATGVEVTAHLASVSQGQAGAPAADEALTRAAVVVELEGPGGPDGRARVRRRLGEGLGAHVGRVPLPAGAVGDWRVEARAEADGKILATGRAAFRVEETHPELARRAADPEALERVAEATGGRSWPLEDLTETIRTVRSRNQPYVKPVSRREPLGGEHWLLAAFLAALGLEWWLRRREDVT